MRLPFATLDRYLLRLTLGRLGAIVGIITFVLALETVPRLLNDVGSVDNQMGIVFRALVNLLPEYVGNSLPLAVFLGTGLLFRQLAMGGELDVLAASGISATRLLRTPFLVAGSCTLMLIAITGFWQPAGERGLETIFHSASQGAFGIALPAGTANRLGSNTYLYFDAISPGGDLLDGVLLQQDKVAITARHARVVETPHNEALLALTQGLVHWPAERRAHAVHFESYSIVVPVKPENIRRPKTASERLRRLDLDALLAFKPAANGDISRAMARAAASTRIAGALFCLVLPLLGYGLGVPAKRSRSAIGLGVGLVSIILFWRLAGLVETHFASLAAVGDALLLALFAAAGIALTRWQSREGPGIAEAALLGLWRRLKQKTPWLRRIPAAPPPQAGWQIL